MTYPATGYTVVVDGVTEIVAAHINQLENKVGYDNDTSPTTLDYRVKYLETYAALLPGRAGGQILYGGTGASEELTLKSTSNATKGLINLSENIGLIQTFLGGDDWFSVKWDTTNFRIQSAFFPFDFAYEVSNLINRGPITAFGPIVTDFYWGQDCEKTLLTLNGNFEIETSGTYNYTGLSMLMGMSSGAQDVRGISLDVGYGIAYGEYTGIYVKGDGTSDNNTATGLYIRTNFEDAATVYGINVAVVRSITTNPSTAYGIFIGSGSFGAYTNNYGLYINGVSGATTDNFNIYSAGASSKNYFEGLVGIGVTTPGAALDVVGQALIGDGCVTIGRNGGLGWGGHGELFLNRENTDCYLNLVYSTGFPMVVNGPGTWAVGLRAAGDPAGNTSGDDLCFWYDPLGFVMILKTDGKVGIGTTAPAKKLHVYGNGIYTQIDSGGVGDGGSIYFGSTSGSIPIAQIKSKAFSAGFGYLSFYTNISGSPYTSTERMTIDWEGKVGIGTIGPNKKLEVTDTASAQLRLAYNGSNYADFTVNSSGSLTIAPSNPASVNITGKLDVSAKVKVGTLLYFAAETDNGNGGASKTIDWTVNNHQKITLNSATCTLTFTAPSGPSVVYLKVVQDGTGGRLITWPTIKWGGATPPTLTTAINAIDLICFYYDGTLYNGMYTLNFA